MNRTQKILTCALLLQLVLCLVFWTTRVALPGVGSAKPFVEANFNEITGFEITSRDEKGVETSIDLEKGSEGWVLHSASDFPAEIAKVEDIIQKIENIDVREPIAENEKSHDALKVSERNFERRVILKWGDKTETLYFSSAKGNTVIARRATENKVYATSGISTWALGVQPQAYLKARLVDMDDVVRIDVSNANGLFTLQKLPNSESEEASAKPVPQIDQWVVTPLQGPIDSGATRSFAATARFLSMVAPVAKGAKPEHGFATGAAVALSSEKETKKIFIGAQVPNDPEHYFAQVEGSEFVVKIAKFAAEKVLHQSVLDFAEKPKTLEEPKSYGFPQNLPADLVPSLLGGE